MCCGWAKKKIWYDGKEKSADIDEIFKKVEIRPNVKDSHWKKEAVSSKLRLNVIRTITGTITW